MPKFADYLCCLLVPYLAATMEKNKQLIPFNESLDSSSIGRTFMSLGTLPVGGKVLAPNSEPIFIGCLILTKIVAYLCRSVKPSLAAIAEKFKQLILFYESLDRSLIGRTFMSQGKLPRGEKFSTKVKTKFLCSSHFLLNCS